MDDITKHTIKIVRALRSPATSFSKKLIEIFLEILIITFAVSLGQFLEKQREENAQQKEVKEFLLGLRYDLKHDASETKKIIKQEGFYRKAYTFLSNLKKGEKPNADSLKKYLVAINETTSLRSDISRFEGFKSSGKLQEIKNKDLLQDILYFYEEAIPVLNISENAWLNFHNKLTDLFVDEHVDYPDGSNNSYQVLIQQKAHNLCKGLIPWSQLLERYQAIITLGNKITKEIDLDYPNQ
jgi:hypothetical protein